MKLRLLAEIVLATPTSQRQLSLCAIAGRCTALTIFTLQRVGRSPALRFFGGHPLAIHFDLAKFGARKVIVWINPDRIV